MASDRRGVVEIVAVSKHLQGVGIRGDAVSLRTANLAFLSCFKIEFVLTLLCPLVVSMRCGYFL